MAKTESSQSNVTGAIRFAEPSSGATRPNSIGTGMPYFALRYSSTAARSVSESALV